MGASFRLSDLVPDPMTFTDDAYGGNGAVYEVLTADLLSEAGIAAMLHQERRMAQSFAVDRSAEALDAANKLIGILIPALPAERLTLIPVTFKVRFIQFWQENQPQAPKATAATPNQTPTQRGRRSRVSSPVTA